MSRDGRVIVGSSYRATGGPTAFMWSEETGTVNINAFGSATTYARSVNADGSVVVGYVNEVLGFIWKPTTGMRLLPPPPIEGSWSATAVNGPGTFIAGYNDLVVGSGLIIWDRDLHPVDYGRPAVGIPGQPVGISDDGSIVALRSVGFDERTSDLNSRVWTRSGGFYTLREYLGVYGVTFPSDVHLSELNGMSADGQTFVGTARNVSGEYWGFVATVPAPGVTICFGCASLIARRRRRRTLTCVLGLVVTSAATAQTPGFWTITPGAGELVDVRAISADGVVVAGHIYRPAAPTNEQYSPFTWTREGGRVVLPGTSGSNMSATALDGAGLTVVGEGAYQNVKGAGWMQSGSSLPVRLTNIIGHDYGGASDISRDGRVIVGTSNTTRQPGIPSQPRAYRWTPETGSVEIGTRGTGVSWANAVSGDGSTVVGSYGSSPAAYVWRESTGMQVLPAPIVPGGTTWYAYAVNGTGDYVAGRYSTATDGRLIRWHNGVIDADPGNPSWSNRANAVSMSDDGRMIAGNTDAGSTGPSAKPFVWSDGTGFVPLVSYLGSFGVIVPPNLTYMFLSEMSPDARTFAGYGQTTSGQWVGFVATVPGPGLTLIGIGCCSVFAIRRRRGLASS